MPEDHSRLDVKEGITKERNNENQDARYENAKTSLAQNFGRVALVVGDRLFSSRNRLSAHGDYGGEQQRPRPRPLRV